MWEKLGGRKSVGLLVVLAIAVPVALAIGDVPTNLMEILLGAFGIFALGNGVEHFSRAKVDAAIAGAKSGETRGRPAKVDLSPVLEKLDAMAQGDGTDYRSEIMAISNRQALTLDQVQKLTESLQQLVQIQLGKA